MTQTEALENLKQLDLKSTSQEIVRELFRVIGNVPAVETTLDINNIIIRTRIGRGYYTQRDLACAPISKCSYLQRATLPNETAFYGCISDSNKKLEYGRIIGLYECSNLARSETECIGRQYVTASQWKILQPLKCISFINDKTFPRTNDLSKQIRFIIEAYKKANLTTVQKELGNFLTTEFCKQVRPNHNHEYLITATIIHDMLYANEYNYDAVLYPSVPVEGRFGINVVIKPDIVKNKLSLYRVINQSYFKSEIESLLRIDGGYDNKGHLLSAEKQDTDEKICKKLGIRSLKDLPIIK